MSHVVDMWPRAVAATGRLMQANLLYATCRSRFSRFLSRAGGSSDEMLQQAWQSRVVFCLSLLGEQVYKAPSPVLPTLQQPGISSVTNEHHRAASGIPATAQPRHKPPLHRSVFRGTRTPAPQLQMNPGGLGFAVSIGFLQDSREIRREGSHIPVLEGALAETLRGTGS